MYYTTLKKIYIILLDQLIHFQWTQQFLIVLKKKNSKIRDWENNTEKDNIYWKHQFKKRKRLDISWEINVSILLHFCLL